VSDRPIDPNAMIAEYDQHHAYYRQWFEEKMSEDPVGMLTLITKIASNPAEVASYERGLGCLKDLAMLSLTRFMIDWNERGGKPQL